MNERLSRVHLLPTHNFSMIIDRETILKSDCGDDHQFADEF